MPRHPSNAERISRAAAEAEAADLQKAGRKLAAPKTPARPRASTARARPRQKVVWAVGRPGLEPTKTFPYLEKDAAEAEAKKKGGDYRVVALKVPME